MVTGLLLHSDGFAGHEHENWIHASGPAGLVDKEGLQDKDLLGCFYVEHLSSSRQARPSSRQARSSNRQARPSSRQARPTLRATLWDLVTLARTWTTAWVLDAGCGLEKASLSEGSDSGTTHTEPQACKCCNSFMHMDAARSSCC